MCDMAFISHLVQWCHMASSLLIYAAWGYLHLYVAFVLTFLVNIICTISQMEYHGHFLCHICMFFCNNQTSQLKFPALAESSLFYHIIRVIPSIDDKEFTDKSMLQCPLNSLEGFIYVKQHCFWESRSSIYRLPGDMMISIGEVGVIISVLARINRDQSMQSPIAEEICYAAFIIKCLEIAHYDQYSAAMNRIKHRSDQRIRLKIPPQWFVLVHANNHVPGGNQYAMITAAAWQ